MRVLVLVFLLFAAAARAEEPRGLLYFSAEHASDSYYGGSGFMATPRGLDRDGPVVTVEIGRTLASGNRLGVMAGWRILRGRWVATALAGLDIGSDSDLAASVDVWWDDRDWMGSFRGAVTGDESSWRSSVGRRAGEGLPWIGAELGENWDGRRIGLHVTGLRLTRRFDARASLGGSDEGGYAELTLWRSF